MSFSDVESGSVPLPGQASRYCLMCNQAGAQSCCTSCDPSGAPYHEGCWDKQPLHLSRSHLHRRSPVDYIWRLRYLNEPNETASIADEVFGKDEANCFIEVDISSKKAKLGKRSSPLLPWHHGLTPHPSFVSFIGHTMNGKSFLLRALQYMQPATRYPSPISAPGASEFGSTSCDINLYADAVTADSDSPILFLDCEGFEGSDIPRSLLRKTKEMTVDVVHRGRYDYVNRMYPRFLYTFSTCMVYVTSAPLGASSEIGRKLVSHASTGASGSQNQGFRPSLFVIFNRFDGGHTRNFNWSIESSTRDFLAHEQLAKLHLYYGKIHVIFIPSTDGPRSDIAVSQLDAFRRRLYSEHEDAFLRRRDLHLTFPPGPLLRFIWRALEIFSGDPNAVFDWSAEVGHQSFNSSDPMAPFVELWRACAQNPLTERLSMHERYKETRRLFMVQALRCIFSASHGILR